MHIAFKHLTLLCIYFSISRFHYAHMLWLVHIFCNCRIGFSSFLLWTIGKWLSELIQFLLIWFSHELWVRYYFFDLLSEKPNMQCIWGHIVVVSGEIGCGPTLRPSPHFLHWTMLSPVSIKNHVAADGFGEIAPLPHLRDRVRVGAR